MTPDRPNKLLVEPTFGEKVESWYQRNGNLINIILTILVVGFVGYRIYDYIHDRNVAKANMAYGQALSRFQMAGQAQDEAQKTDQLQGAITAAEQVVAEHGDQYVGQQAQLMIGNAQYQMAAGQPGQGVDMLEKSRLSYQKYLGKATSNEQKAVGNIALGNVLENLAFIQSDEKKLQEAVSAYKDAAAAAEGTALGAEAKLSLARAMSSLNNEKSEAEAAKLFQEVAENRDGKLASVSKDEVKGIEMASGQTLSPEQVIELKNLTAWSQKKIAEDALSRIK